MPKISGIATGQILQVAGKKYKAKGCFDVQKNDYGERLTLFRRSFFYKWIEIMLTRGKSKFLLALTLNML